MVRGYHVLTYQSMWSSLCLLFARDLCTYVVLLLTVTSPAYVTMMSLALNQLVVSSLNGQNVCGNKIFVGTNYSCSNLITKNLKISHHMVQGIMTINVKEGALIRAQCTYPPT